MRDSVQPTRINQEGGRTKRTLVFVISEEQAGRTVREFLQQELHFSRRQISSLKYREDGIRVNGEMSRVSRVLKAGDLLQIVPKTSGLLYLDHGSFDRPPEILFEDRDLLIVNKPSGMVCHPSPGHYADTLSNQAAAYAASQGEDWTIRLVGRLDKDTSGIVIFAKSSEAAAGLSTGRCPVQKTYYAVTEGHPGRGIVTVPIGSDPEVLGKMKADPFGRPAITFFDEIRSEGGLSLVKVRIEHGRTHQIRLHLASIGFPLAGDAMYGRGVKGETHAALHCRQVVFTHPFTGETITVTAPFPADWAIMPET